MITWEVKSWKDHVLPELARSESGVIPQTAALFVNLEVAGTDDEMVLAVGVTLLANLIPTRRFVELRLQICPRMVGCQLLWVWGAAPAGHHPKLLQRLCQLRNAQRFPRLAFGVGIGIHSEDQLGPDFLLGSQFIKQGGHRTNHGNRAKAVCVSVEGGQQQLLSAADSHDGRSDVPGHHESGGAKKCVQLIDDGIRAVLNGPAGCGLVHDVLLHQDQRVLVAFEIHLLRCDHFVHSSEHRVTRDLPDQISRGLLNENQIAVRVLVREDVEGLVDFL
mmetsp:Transcript_18571/g.70235  ORF Transcript_18571/g.70235 Transcript_18571/m.70235 type:complete len:276 (+) Transcript_18571:131-958(+)